MVLAPTVKNRIISNAWISVLTGLSFLIGRVHYIPDTVVDPDKTAKSAFRTQSKEND